LDKTGVTAVILVAQVFLGKGFLRVFSTRWIFVASDLSGREPMRTRK
jgi:hypothetical protein